jgi:membrane associated rhomboid family serine protease/Flp pilus assembly protein TadD
MFANINNESNSREVKIGKFAYGVTFLLIAVNVLVFLLMLSAGASPLKPAPQEILRYGANYGPLTLSGQWWRLTTVIFVHLGIVHLILNMWCLFQLGKIAEHLYGSWTFLFIYFFTGIAASVTSLAWNPMAVTAGASGAIFGVLGALISSVHRARLLLPHKELNSTLVSLLVFASYNLLFGFLRGHVDNAAHVGGLIAGLLIGTFLSSDLESKSKDRRRVFLSAVAFLSFAIVLVQHIHGSVVHIKLAEDALKGGNPNLAIKELVPLTPELAKDPTVYSILGAAYLQQRQFPMSEASYKQVLRLSPRDEHAGTSLGLIYVTTKRFDEARAAFASVATLNPRNTEAWFYQGTALLDLSRYQEAAESFRKAVTLNPSFDQANFELGICEMNLRDYDAAIVAFQQASNLNPNYFLNAIWLANAYEAKGLRKEAEAAFLKAYALRRAAQVRPPGMEYLSFNAMQHQSTLTGSH